MNRSPFLVLILVIITACLICGSNITAQAQDETPVDFPDSNLEGSIRQHIQKWEGPIYPSDLKKLDRLTAPAQGITDLTGLGYCTNLTWLNLSRNPISDLSPLASLTNLTELNLGVNQISNLSPLASLTNLTKLSLARNQISDLSPLASITKLRELELWGNQISDLSPLASLANLTRLALYINQISDTSPLATLTNLTWLGLDNNQISNLSPLASLTNLTMLFLNDNQIRDLSPLASLANLTRLGLRNNQINDLSPLAPLTNLEELYLEGNQIIDISPLASLTNLTELYLNDNQISDISPLLANSGLSTGSQVSLADNPLSDMSINAYVPRLVKRGVSIYGLPGSAAAVIDILHPGILLAVVCIVLAVIMLLVPLYHTHGSRRKRFRRDGLISGVIGAGLLTFFVLFTVGFNCQYCWWYIERPEMWSFVAAPGILLFTSVAIAWKWEHIGGILLIIEGILCPPLLLSGVLFLLSSGEARRPLTSERVSRRLRRAGLIYVLVVTAAIGPACFWVVDEYIVGMEMLAPTFILILVGLFLLPGIVLAWLRKQHAGGVLMITAGLLAILGPFVTVQACLPVHMFFIVTLPLAISGALFLLSWKEERKHLAQLKDDHSD